MRRPEPSTYVALVGLSAALLGPGPAPRADEVKGPCPGDMVLSGPKTCIDPFEAYLEELDASGTVTGVHPANELVGKKRVRAANRRGATPQAYISQAEAGAACAEAGKRLCTDNEWLAACQGTPKTRYPYGTRRRAGYCNDAGTEALPAVFPGRMNDWNRLMNDPRLDKVPGTVAPSGSFTRCRGELEVFDMVGNVHEWTADPAGTMRGGFFLDTTKLGEGCEYDANGHDTAYHDYSTGFRCCKDANTDTTPR
ncbi:MAG: SUMF1/EgtB/PvdO family nonheme iron enzyme [Polyangiaceae bacterium]